MAATKGVRPHEDPQANRHDRCSGGQLTPLAALLSRTCPVDRTTSGIHACTLDTAKPVGTWSPCRCSWGHFEGRKPGVTVAMDGLCSCGYLTFCSGMRAVLSQWDAMPLPGQSKIVSRFAVFHVCVSSFCLLSNASAVCCVYCVYDVYDVCVCACCGVKDCLAVVAGPDCGVGVVSCERGMSQSTVEHRPNSAAGATEAVERSSNNRFT